MVLRGDLAQLTALKELAIVIEGNEPQPPLPPAARGALTRLSLTSMCLTAVRAPWSAPLSAYTSLRALRLQVSTVPPDAAGISTLSYLRSLDVELSILDTCPPSAFFPLPLEGRLPELIHVRVASPHSGGSAATATIDALSCLPQLRDLEVSLAIGFTCFSPLATLIALTRLALHCTPEQPPETATRCKWISSHKQLRELCLPGAFAGWSMDFVCWGLLLSLEGMSKLKRVNLAGCEVSRQLVKELAALTGAPCWQRMLRMSTVKPGQCSELVRIAL
jgi:hypothetical protein